MRVLFLSLLDFNSLNDQNIYTDLLREFAKNGHDVYCISPVERRTGIKTHLRENGHILKLKIGNIQKTNFIEKGISTLRVERQFISGIKRYFSAIKFDVVLYATPPITFASVIKYVKHRDNARTYLMLKDIFPQNAVDVGLMVTGGVKGSLYRYFRQKEKELYALSDRIGCMSQRNVDYLLEHNPEISRDRVDICPNCVDVRDVCSSARERLSIREMYGLPLDKKIFVYGGNLGKPQDVPFIIRCLKEAASIDDAYFMIAGSGTDRYLFEEYILKEQPSHVKLFDAFSKYEFDSIISCCDIGVVFLDHRFTIPNFPSRLLSYMQAGLPVLACTDPSTDIGDVIIKGNFGWSCESNDCQHFCRLIRTICSADTSDKSRNARVYLAEHFSAQKVYGDLQRSIASMLYGFDPL